MDNLGVETHTDPAERDTCALGGTLSDFIFLSNAITTAFSTRPRQEARLSASISRLSQSKTRRGSWLRTMLPLLEILSLWSWSSSSVNLVPRGSHAPSEPCSDTTPLCALLRTRLWDLHTWCVRSQQTGFSVRQSMPHSGDTSGRT